MQNDDQLLVNRFNDLYKKAENKGYAVFSDFLNLQQQSVLKNMRFYNGVRLFGGYEFAERKVACFLENEYIEAVYPLSCVKISPVSEKFSDRLSHRDFLGSVLGLGIKREVIGDILLEGNCGYMFCLESIGKYIADNLEFVKHTRVECEITRQIPENIINIPEKSELIVSSCRIDVLVAAVFNLSRNITNALFEGKKVFIDGGLAENNSAVPKTGAVVSARGYGRFIFEGAVRKTRRDKNVVEVRIFK